MEAEVKVLDHGYVKPIEAWGTDASIIEAARMSTSKGFQGWGAAGHASGCPDYGDKLPRFPLVCGTCEAYAGDEVLLRYLYEHKHMTPFEMCGLTIEVQAPIFVFREWHRHRTQSYNELSARYTELPNMFYVPSVERVEQSAAKSANKQASGGGVLDEHPLVVQGYIEEAQRECRRIYERLLAKGVSKEVARVVIPVSQYSRMRASANLRNWLAFLTLRLDPAAQWEIRQFAEAVAGIIEREFPRTWALFVEGKSSDA